MENNKENKDIKKSLSSEEADWLENLFQSEKPNKQAAADPAPSSDLELEMIMAEVKYDGTMPILSSKSNDDAVAKILAEENKKSAPADATVVISNNVAFDLPEEPEITIEDALLLMILIHFEWIRKT